jgi:HAD superfamily hydrolase (TIGR01509 family)
MSSIRVLFFDLGDTLVRIRPQLFERAAERIAQALGYTGVDASRRKQVATALQKAIKDEWQERDGEKLQSVNSEEEEYKYWIKFYRAVLSRLGLVPAPKRLLSLLAHMQADPASFDCFEDVEETLDKLRNMGIGLGLISNAFPSADGILEHLDLNRWFDYTVLSYKCQSKAAKPEEIIYLEALEQAGLQPEEAALVDDRLSFVRGAEKVRMPALLIDRRYQANGNVKHKIHNLNEVVDFVKRRQREVLRHSPGPIQPVVESL